MRRIKREKRICKCGCGKSFVCKINDTKQFLENHYQKTAPLKGKTWEEIHGVVGAKNFREKRKKTRTGKKLNRNKPSYKKGKTMEEIYGIERAKEIKKKGNLANILNGKNWTKEKIIKSYLELPSIRKSELKKLRKEKKLPDRNTINKYFGNLDELIKITNKPFLNIKGKNGLCGENEIKLLDKIEEEKLLKLERQFPVQNNNSKFYLDGYDPINNIAYEIDEPHHKYNQIQDIIRENKIKEILGCSFIRIKDGW